MDVEITFLKVNFAAVPFKCDDGVIVFQQNGPLLETPCGIMWSVNFGNTPWEWLMVSFKNPVGVLGLSILETPCGNGLLAYS